MVFNENGVVILEVAILDEHLRSAELIEMLAGAVVEEGDVGECGRADQEDLDIARVAAQNYNRNENQPIHFLFKKKSFCLTHW